MTTKTAPRRRWIYDLAGPAVIMAMIGVGHLVGDVQGVAGNVAYLTTAALMIVLAWWALKWWRFLKLASNKLNRPPLRILRMLRAAHRAQTAERQQRNLAAFRQKLWGWPHA